MPLTEPTVRASVLAFMPDYLEQRGAAIGPLLDEAGLDAAAIDDPKTQLSLNAVVTLFDSAARSFGDPAFGLDYARHFPVGGSGLLDHMLMSAPTVKDALNLMAHYQAVYMTAVSASFEMRDDAGRLAWEWPTSFAASPAQYTAFCLGALVLRLRLAAGPDWRPVAVGFQHRAPEALTTYRPFFGAHVTFDQPQNSIAVDAATLAKPMPRVMQGLFDSVRELGDRMLLEQSAPTDIASRTQTAIAHRLSREEPFDLETIAAAFAMTPRSLQWRLAQAATTYEKVLTLTRIVQAEQYLRDTDHPMTAIAALLGFSELSAFTRWAHRQLGATPTALRQRRRRATTS